MKQPCIDSTFYILLIGVAATQNTLAWTTLPSTSKNLPHRCAQSQRWSYNKNPDDNNEMDEADLNIFSMGDLFRDGSFDPDGSFDADDFQDIASSLSLSSSSSSSSSSSNNLDDNNNNNEMDEANLNLFSMGDLFTDFNDDAVDATTATSSTTTSFDEETMSSLSSSLSSSTNTNPYINNAINNNNNNNNNDDIVDIVDNPGSLQRLARGSDNTVWANSINLRKEQSSYGQLDAETLAKMQEIAEQEEAMKEKTNNDGNNNTNNNNNNNNNKNDYESSASASALQQQDEVRNAELEEIMGEDYQDLSFFLSEDDYMRASRSIKADGSLPEYIFEESTIDDIFGNTSKETKKQQQQAAARPNNLANSRANGALSSNAKFDNDDDDDDDDDETSMRELMNMLKQKESIPETDDKLQAKEIRDRVFSQEETFASQHVDSDEYKLYEEAITTGLLNKDQGGDGGGGGDEVDQALEGLQEMINQKYSTGRDAQPQQLSAKSEDDYISSTSTTKE